MSSYLLSFVRMCKRTKKILQIWQIYAIKKTLIVTTRMLYILDKHFIKNIFQIKKICDYSGIIPLCFIL